MALMLHDNYTARFGLICSAAAAEVALLLGFNEKTIRIWRRYFFVNKGEFSEYRRGSYVRYAVLQDQEYRDLALEWVRANSISNGSPNLIRRVREYARGYREGFAAGPELVKLYKSHRPVSEL